MNYLTPILIKYFKEITHLEGTLLTINSFISFVQKELDSKPDGDIIQLISNYRDLSKLNDDNNLFWTGMEYNFSSSDLQNNAHLLISRECCYTIEQAYEIFESFLKEITVELLRNKKEYIELVNCKDSAVLDKTEDYRVLVNKFQRNGKNNKRILWLFREISEFYQKHEKENILNYDFADWFDLISEIRHAITHNRQRFTDKVKSSISKDETRIIFNRYFDQNKSVETGLIITNLQNTNETILLFNQFAFLIWKSLSIECRVDINYTYDHSGESL